MAAIAGADPDVILIGLENPSRDVLEQMFTLSRIVKRPVAMFVDQSDESQMEAAIAAGVSAYVVDGFKKERIKPILAMSIIRFRAFSRLQDELAETKMKLQQRDTVDKAKRVLMRMKNLSEEEALREHAQNRDERETTDFRDRVRHLDGGGSAAMSAAITVGFIPLVDAALLVAARDIGFAEAEGLALDLVRDVTWANLRDRLAVGQIDAAHMLAPAALAVSLGSHQVKVPIATPIALNRDGNALAVSHDLAVRLAGAGYVAGQGPGASAAALGSVIRSRQARGAADLVFATVYPYSMHSILLDAWLGGAGLKSTGHGLRIEVIPPPFLVEAIRAGEIDGFCSGAPWHALAAEQGHGIVLHLGTDLLPDAPEKVLAFRADDIDGRSDLCDALVRALVAAAGWCADPANRPRLAAILAAGDVLDVPAALIERVLAGYPTTSRGAPPGPPARIIPPGHGPVCARASAMST